MTQIETETPTPSPTPKNGHGSGTKGNYALTSVEVDGRLKDWQPEELFKHVPHAIVVTHFTSESANQFSNDLAKAVCGQKIVPVIVDSYGGDAYAMWTMVAAIRSAQKAGVIIATITSSKAMSAGAVLFAAGTAGYRFIGYGAQIMIHDVSSFTWGKNAEIQSYAKAMAQLNNDMLSHFDRATGSASGTWDAKLQAIGRADLYLDAQQAIDCGLASTYGIPKLVTKVTVETTLEI